MIYLSYTNAWQPEGKGLIKDSKAVFISVFDVNNLMNPLCKEIVKFIDKSEVLYPGVIKSPVLGYIPPEKLSGGCQHVLLAWHGGFLHDSAKMGENCFEPLTWVAKEKDIYVRWTTMAGVPDRLYQTGLFYNVDEGRLVKSFNDSVILQYKYDDTGYYPSKTPIFNRGLSPEEWARPYIEEFD